MQRFFLLLVLLVPVVLKAQLPGNSVQLKANANYISVADASSILLNDTMTIEMMVYFRCNNVQSTQLLTKGWCGSNWSFYLSVNDQKLRLAKWHSGLTGCSGNHAMFESTDSIELNTWTHIAVRVVDLNVEFLINGVNAGSTLLSGTNGDGFHVSNQPLRIGSYLNISNVHQGTPKSNIDELRIWHTARTDAELLANMNQELSGNEPGLKAYYKLNESGSGSGISVLNSAAGSSVPNGVTNGTAANILFNDNSSILNSLPTCDPVLWLKADAGAYTNAGTTLAADGQSVQQWNDQSDNAYHCSQADASKRPIWQAHAFYGKPALWFDGVNGNYWLENATQTPVATAGMPRTYFVVAKADCQATGYAGGHLFTNRRSPNASTLEFVQNGSGIFHGGNFCCNHPEVTNVNFDDGRLKPFIGSWRTGGTNTNLDFWFNGVSKTTANANFVADNGNPGYCVGDRRDAFQFDQPNGAYDWQGHIAEIIVFNYALTNKQRIQIENYLKAKYQAAIPGVFTSIPTTSAYSNQLLEDAVWTHSFNTLNNNEIIASVKDDCLELGTRSDTVYLEPTALSVGNAFYMRRHYVIQSSLNPPGTKRVRLYYTAADFADLQNAVPGLNSHSQLCVTKYDGPQEDGQFNSAGGNISFIPSSAITTGVFAGQYYLEFDVDGFSEFWIHSGNTALPLDLISFTGSKQNNAFLLQWETANMSQVKGFEIEKSSDAKTYTLLGFVGSSNANHYSFRDISAMDLLNYYRLKMMDMNGQYRYSSTLVWRQQQPTALSIYPNPVKDELHIVSNDTHFEYQVMDLFGRIWMQGESSSNRLSILIPHLLKGNYILRIQTDADIETVKFIKE
jgi:hypothetical protein